MWMWIYMVPMNKLHNFIRICDVRALSVICRPSMEHMIYHTYIYHHVFMVYMNAYHTSYTVPKLYLIRIMLLRVFEYVVIIIYSRFYLIYKHVLNVWNGYKSIRVCGFIHYEWARDFLSRFAKFTSLLILLLKCFYYYRCVSQFRLWLKRSPLSLSLYL